jgi:hypothetical protein
MMVWLEDKATDGIRRRGGIVGMDVAEDWVMLL